MTRIWKQSQREERHTDAFVATCDWQLIFDHALGVSKWEKDESRAPAIIETESMHDPDDFFYAGSMFIVSSALRDLFGMFAVHADYLPVRVMRLGQEYMARKLYCCNILDAVDCFDFGRGECSFHQEAPFSGHIDKITKLAIDEEKASSYHLFRIAKGAEHVVCVSDALASRIEMEGMTGMAFVAPEEWSAC